ncbi:uncharacterized protein LOC142327140 isoform X2 [Lycorma delicatula]|uniref:uncharacterized protein LOC142327140 isoform X2 n=1 Tax=Lycorma delicatula TaxID=130591 RepID=UPI003F50E766
MAGDQQFCLRWNNHQSTLVSVFDALLENSVLVDCTLAADGQQLKAHKVVLSACSPYLETLLSQHYDKHPIIILKDVKYPELKAMLDYMYRGEVNISQDLLGSFLKAAESLQIKGLTDSGGGGEPANKQQELNRKQTALNLPTPITSVINNQTRATSTTHSEERKQSLIIPTHVIDNRSQSPLLSREGSVSPTVRKRKKLNQLNKSDNPKLVKPFSDTGKINNCQNEQPSQIISATLAPSSPAAMTVIKSEPDTLPLSNKTELKQNIDDNNDVEDSHELDNDENNENVFDDDTTNTTSPGPSHHFISQGFSEKSALGDSSSEIVLQSSDDLQSSNQERHFGHMMKKVWQSTKTQNIDYAGSHICPRCGKRYSLKGNLTRHLRFECGKEPQFQCYVCLRTFTRNDTLTAHLKMLHRLL